MSDILKKAFSLGVGLTIVSKEKIEQVVDDLVKKGELAPSESKQMIARLLEKGEEEQNELKRMVQEQVKKVLDSLDVATKQDLQELELRLKKPNDPAL